MNSPVDGLLPPRRYWSLATIWLAMAMAVLDGVIANVALPTVTAALGVSPVLGVWVINAYQIAVVMLLLPFAAAGEIFGYRRVYLCGVALFVVASLGCATAPNFFALTAWRFVQGIGGAAIMAVNSALVRYTFPASQLGRGIGYNALVVSLSFAAGPSIAALILAFASWGWLFAINLPIGIVIMVIGFRALPSSERASRAFDSRASLLNAIAFFALFFTASHLVSGALGPWLLVSAAVAIAAGGILLRTSRTQTEPLVPIDLLRMPRLRASYIASVTAFAGQMLGLVALPFYLQQRFDHVSSGLLITAFPVGVAIGAPLSGRLSDRVSAGPLGMTGLVFFALGYVLLALAGAPQRVAIIACLAIAGFGFGLFQAPNNRVMIGDSPRRRSGAAAGMLAVCRLLGQTFGALLAALSFRLFGTGSSVAFVIAAVLGIIGGIASAARRANAQTVT